MYSSSPRLLLPSVNGYVCAQTLPYTATLCACLLESPIPGPGCTCIPCKNRRYLCLYALPPYDNRCRVIYVFVCGLNRTQRDDLSRSLHLPSQSTHTRTCAPVAVRSHLCVIYIVGRRRILSRALSLQSYNTHTERKYTATIIITSTATPPQPRHLYITIYAPSHHHPTPK